MESPALPAGGQIKKIKQHNDNVVDFEVELFASLCRLLITFANSLYPHQARDFVVPDLDPSCLTLRWHILKNFSKTLILKIISIRQSMEKLPSMQQVSPI